MKRYRHTHILSLLTLCLTLLTAGCKKDEQIQPEEQTIVQISIPQATRAGGSLSVDGEEIQKLRILIFNEAGRALDAQKTFVSGSSDLTKYLRVEAHTGEKVVYVIANEAAEMSDALDKLLFERELLAMEIPYEDPDGTTGKPIILVGKGSHTVTLTKGQIAQTKVSLIRSRAKITLDLQQKTPQEDKVIIQRVSINRLPKRSLLVTPATFTLGNSWTYTQDTKQPLTNNGPAVHYIPESAPLYVYENIGSLTDTTGRAPILTVETLYNGILSTYTAYVNDDTSDAQDHHYALHRNCHYQLTGTITKIGKYDALLLTTRVLPWDLEEVNKQLILPKISILSPQLTTSNKTSVATPFVVRIQIKGDDEYTHWTATLTNAVDFAFDTSLGRVTEGLADGTTAYEVAVVPTREHTSTQHQTQLLFTMGGLVIPIEGFPAGIPIVQERDI